MVKQPEDSLESFFLNRVGDYKIDYREEDWQNLNEMLDAAVVMKAGALRQKIVWVGSGALLVISVLLLLWMSQNLTGNRIEDITSEVNPETVEITKNTHNFDRAENAEYILKEEDQTNENQVRIAKDSDGQTGNNEAPGTSNDDDISKNQSQAFIQPLQIIENQSISEPKRIENAVSNKNEDEPVNSGIENSRGAAPSITTNDNSSNKVIGSAGDDSQESALISLTPSGLNFDMVNENRFIMSSDLRQSSNKLVLRKNYSWNFSIAADNSAVGMNDFSGPKLRIGLSAEHYFSPRASIVAGVNYSIKEYTALGKEYKVAYGNWNGGVSPDETFGTCNVLDIPIDFTYYVHNKKGQAFFLRGGLSSWLMLEEHYYFSYNSNDPDLIGYWGGMNENYHYFSIFNLSGGFEYPLNPKFSIMAEPYLNVPLGGVGYGNVKLYSAGLRFILKINHYKLVSEE